MWETKTTQRRHLAKKISSRNKLWEVGNASTWIIWQRNAKVYTHTICSSKFSINEGDHQKNQPLIILMLQCLAFSHATLSWWMCSVLSMAQPPGKNPLRFSLECAELQPNCGTLVFSPISFVTSSFTWHSFMSVFHRVALCIYKENVSLRQQHCDSCWKQSSLSAGPQPRSWSAHSYFAAYITIKAIFY